MTPGISAEAERLLLLNAIGDVKFAAQSASSGAWVDGGEEILRAAGERTNTILRTSSHDLNRRLADVAYILAVQPEAMIALCDRLTRLLREPAPGSREPARRVADSARFNVGDTLQAASAAHQAEVARQRVLASSSLGFGVDEADLIAENSRLRAQLDASEQQKRIQELQEACTRHESEAREARAALADRPIATSFVNDEVQLRQTQLGEIRAMLGLALDAEHLAVIEALADIGSFDVRIDLNAVPERYAMDRGLLRAGKRRKAGS